MNKLWFFIFGTVLPCNASEETAATSSSLSVPSQRSSSSSSESKVKLDAIDRAIELSSSKEEVTGETILSHLDALRDLEAQYKRELKKARQSRENPSHALLVSLRALEVAAAELRINWADRILNKATEDSVKKNTALRVEVETCLEELEVYITSQVLRVNEPYEAATKTQLRIDQLFQETTARQNSKSQLELEQAVWNEVIQKNGQHLHKEKAIFDGEASLTSPLKGAEKTTQSLTDYKNANAAAFHKKVQDALERKKQIMSSMKELLKECKSIDQEFIPKSIVEVASDDDDDNYFYESAEEKTLNAFYSNFSLTLQSLVEHIPFQQAMLGCESVQDIQDRYQQLLLLERLGSQATLASITSLLAVTTECEQNRTNAIQQMISRKQVHMEHYEQMKKDLESVKLRQARIKVLLGKDLNMFETERLKRAASLETHIQLEDQ